jgi:hypothetical protein
VRKAPKRGEPRSWTGRCGARLNFSLTSGGRSNIWSHPRPAPSDSWRLARRRVGWAFSIQCSGIANRFAVPRARFCGTRSRPSASTRIRLPYAMPTTNASADSRFRRPHGALSGPMRPIENQLVNAASRPFPARAQRCGPPFRHGSAGWPPGSAVSPQTPSRPGGRPPPAGFIPASSAICAFTGRTATSPRPSAAPGR